MVNNTTVAVSDSTVAVSDSTVSGANVDLSEGEGAASGTTGTSSNHSNSIDVRPTMVVVAETRKPEFHIPVGFKSADGKAEALFDKQQRAVQTEMKKTKGIGVPERIKSEFGFSSYYSPMKTLFSDVFQFADLPMLSEAEFRKSKPRDAFLLELAHNIVRRYHHC